MTAVAEPPTLAVDAGAVRRRVQAVAALPGVPAQACHLVGAGGAGDVLWHAVGVGTVARPAPLSPAGDAWLRWLVWLGPAAPPGPPSHLRFGRIGAGTPAGVIVPFAGTEPEWTVDPGPDGAAVVSDGRRTRWREVARWTGVPVPLDLPGYRAAVHHDQCLPGGARHPVLIVRRELPG